MPDFPHTLLSIGKICDANCRVLFEKHKVSVLNHFNRPILTGWREPNGSRLWRVSLTENTSPPISQSPTQVASNAYTIPNTKDLIDTITQQQGIQTSQPGYLPLKQVISHLGLASPL